MRDDTRNRREHEQHRGQRERVLVRTSPDSRTGAERQQTNRLAAAVQCHHEQPVAPVLAALGIAQDGADAVIDLRLLAGRSDDRHAGSGGWPPRRLLTKRCTLWWLLAKPNSETRSCQMACAFRPRLSPSSMCFPVRLAGTGARTGLRRCCMSRATHFEEKRGEGCSLQIFGFALSTVFFGRKDE
jgi:hypothetical protein